MPTLFDPIKVGDLGLANRIVMAPLTRNRSPRAVPTDLSAVYYAQRATAGLIITEAISITHQAQGFSNVPGLYEPEQLHAWKKVTDAVHAAGGTIVAQIWHVGRIAHSSLQPGGAAPVGPSAIKPKDARTYVAQPDGTGDFVETSTPRALELAEIPGLIEDWRRAARAAVDSGFDGVEIHAANGFLLDQFLRSSSNQRVDAYGGSIENRLRFPLEVVGAISAEIGSGRVGLRISPAASVNDCFDPDPQTLFTHFIERLAASKIAYIHVVEGQTGGPRDFHHPDNQPFDFRALHTAYKSAGGRGAWMVNNGYDRELAEISLENGDSDLVAFGKLFLANPDLVSRFRENAGFNQPDPTTFFGGDGGARGYTDYPSL
jgi:N-ethylmaleimide reductase